MSAHIKRVREQAVVYLADRDRALLEELVHESGLSRAELFRRGLWALAEQMRGGERTSAFEALIAESDLFQGPADYSERSDDYLYGGKPLLNRVAESASTASGAAGASATADAQPASKKRAKRARPR